LFAAKDLRSSSIAVNAALGSTTINRPFGMPGTISLNPRYDIQGGVPDATIGYSYEKTSLNVDAQSQRLTLSHIFGKDNSNQIVPSLSTKSKDFCVSYSRNLPAGRVTTTWKPDDSIALQFSDGGWDATIRAPLEGNFLKAGSGFKLSVKRNVGISLF